MLVSVIIPTYNRKEYICAAIDSVLSQTITTYEIVVVDDGSTDGTGELLRQRYGDQIRYFYQHNQGEAVARNRAIAESQGQLIALLDSDDVWHPNKLERQLQFFEAHPEVGLVSCQALVIDAAGESKRPTPIYAAFVPEIVPLETLILNSPLYCSSVIIRKACLDEVGVFEPTIRYGEDRDLFLRVAARYPVGYVSEPLVSLRSHQGAQSRLLIPAEEMERRIRDRLKIIERVFPLFTGDPKALESLRSRALAKEYVRAAIYDYVRGQFASGAKRLSDAVALDYATWGNGDRIADHIGDYAVALAVQKSPAEAIGFVTAVFTHLPEEIQGRVGCFRRNIRARIHAESAFFYTARGETGPVPHHVLRAYCNDPSLIGNLGLLSIGVQSLTGLTPRKLLGRVFVASIAAIAAVICLRLLVKKAEKSTR